MRGKREASLENMTLQTATAISPASDKALLSTKPELLSLRLIPLTFDSASPPTNVLLRRFPAARPLSFFYLGDRQ